MGVFVCAINFNKNMWIVLAAILIVSTYPCHATQTPYNIVTVNQYTAGGCQIFFISDITFASACYGYSELFFSYVC